jgi:hypothetical protein
VFEHSENRSWLTRYFISAEVKRSCVCQADLCSEAQGIPTSLYGKQIRESTIAARICRKLKLWKLFHNAGSGCKERREASSL